MNEWDENTEDASLCPPPPPPESGGTVARAGESKKRFPCENGHVQANCSKLPTASVLGATNSLSLAESMAFSMTQSAIRFKLAKPMPTARISCFRGKAESFKATPIVRSMVLAKRVIHTMIPPPIRLPITAMVSARVKPPSVSSMNMY